MERSALFLLHNALAVVTVMTAVVSAGGCSGHSADAPGDDGGSSHGADADDGGSSVPKKTCADACAVCRLQNICSDCNVASAKFRDEFEAVLYPCVTQMNTCSGGWVDCAKQGMAAISTRDVDTAYRSACQAKVAECSSQGTGITDDYCLSSSGFVAEAVSVAQQCLAHACSALPECLRAAFF